MNNLSLPEQITRLVEPLLESLDLELWGLEYLPSTGRAILRIYIEKPSVLGSRADKAAARDPQGADPAPEGADYRTTAELGAEPSACLAVDLAAGSASSLTAGIDECTSASRLIGLSLEVEDLIPSAYVLEVSTPGLERRFFKPAQLAASRGQMVEVQLEQPVASHPFRKRFSGRLDAAAEAEGVWSFTLRLQEPGPEDPPLVEFRWDNVKRAKLVYLEPVKEKPGKKSAASPKAGSGKKVGSPDAASFKG